MKAENLDYMQVMVVMIFCKCVTSIYVKDTKEITESETDGLPVHHKTRQA